MALEKLQRTQKTQWAKSLSNHIRRPWSLIKKRMHWKNERIWRKWLCYWRTEWRREKRRLYKGGSFLLRKFAKKQAMISHGCWLSRRPCNVCLSWSGYVWLCLSNKDGLIWNCLYKTGTHKAQVKIIWIWFWKSGWGLWLFVLHELHMKLLEQSCWIRRGSCSPINNS